MQMPMKKLYWPRELREAPLLDELAVAGPVVPKSALLINTAFR